LQKGFLMKTILITGISRGIGRALAEACLRRGDHVIGTVRPRAASPLRDPRLKVLELDVRDESQIAAAATLVTTPVDVLINNAGVIGQREANTLTTDFAAFADTLNVNVLGPLRVSQAFLPHLRQAKASRILTITSHMGSMSHGKSDRIAYRASKAAVNKVMQGLATDLASEGIAVAVAHPGWVRTDMGGAGADISPVESAAGLLAVVDGMSVANTGRFFNWNGAELPW
jgi:NAD(P)-dependent dehydrogenase (short-subunit alcohol dehydrogenase family)